MANHKIDETGNVYGDLTVLEQDHEHPNAKHETYWLCKCNCGNIVSVSGAQLRSGKTKSCGCLKIRLARKTPEVLLNHENNYGIGFCTSERNKDKYYIFNIKDLDVVKNGAWNITYDGYYTAYKRDNPGKEEAEFLHRAIMSKYGDIEGKEVDHINHFKADNRSETNLRITDSFGNNRNKISAHDLDNDKEKNISFNKENECWQVGFKHTTYEEDEETHELKKVIKNNIVTFGLDEYNLAVAYRDKYKQEHCTDEYYYDKLQDARFFPGFAEADLSNRMHPFFVAEFKCDTVPKDIIFPFITTPFVVIDEDKFNNSKI